MPILSVLLQIRAFGFTASHRTAHEVQVLAGLGLGSGPFLRTHYAIHVERLFFAMFKRDHFGIGVILGGWVRLDAFGDFGCRRAILSVETSPSSHSLSHCNRFPA